MHWWRQIELLLKDSPCVCACPAGPRGMETKKPNSESSATVSLCIGEATPDYRRFLVRHGSEPLGGLFVADERNSVLLNVLRKKSKSIPTSWLEADKGVL